LKHVIRQEEALLLEEKNVLGQLQVVHKYVPTVHIALVQPNRTDSSNTYGLRLYPSPTEMIPEK